jgi:hypothetical protein
MFTHKEMLQGGPKFAVHPVDIPMLIPSGTITQGQVSEDVAIKVVIIAGESQRNLRAARRELAILCTAAQNLKGYAVELRGFCESETELQLIMERCEMSLAKWCGEFDGDRLPLDKWVRCVLSLCSIFLWKPLPCHSTAHACTMAQR